jgi:hypothetical protein
VDADRDAHEEMLRAFNDLAVHAKEVRSLEGLVPNAARRVLFFGFGCSRQSSAPFFGEERF